MLEPMNLEPELVAAHVAHVADMEAKAKAARGGKAVYAAIIAVSREIAELGGISKTHTNVSQNYKFRSIEDVQNLLAGLLAKYELLILLRCLSRQVTERQTRKHDGTTGPVLFSVVLEVEYDFLCATDGSVHTIRVFGEGMDTGDKATNKALSAAYKYACFQTFCIPTATEDADATTHEVIGTQGPRHAPGWKDFTGPTVGAPEAPSNEPLPVDDNAPPEVTIKSVERRKTKNPKVTMFIVTTSTGEELTTIDQNLARAAEQYQAENASVYVSGVNTKFGRRNVVAIEPVIPF